MYGLGIKDRIDTAIDRDAATDEKYAASGNESPDKSLFAIAIGEKFVRLFSGFTDSDDQ